MLVSKCSFTHKKPLIYDNEKEGIVTGISESSYEGNITGNDSTKLPFKINVMWNLSIKMKDGLAEVTATNFKYIFSEFPIAPLESYYHGTQNAEKMTGGTLTPFIRAHNIALFTNVDSQAKAELKWVARFIPFKPAEF